jgi:hypothetical protein
VHLQVSEKNVVMKKKLLTIVLIVVHRVFNSHFIFSLKRYDMVVTTFLYIIIILCYIKKLTIQCQILAGVWANPKKIKLILGIFFLNRWWIFDFETYIYILFIIYYYLYILNFNFSIESRLYNV